MRRRKFSKTTSVSGFKRIKEFRPLLKLKHGGGVDVKESHIEKINEFVNKCESWKKWLENQRGSDDDTPLQFKGTLLVMYIMLDYLICTQ